MDDEPIKNSTNPLECGVCQEEFNNPVQLPCLHVFCKACLLVNEAVDDDSDHSNPARVLACPECQEPLGETPPTDLLAKYLIDTAHETAEICANCDQIAQPMFFCETCQQALCVTCRQNTHQAKMFSSHRMISLEERARVKGRVSCAQHGEPYILFCVDQKRLVCIQCFNGRPLESRHSFVSIDTAHSANVEKLERWASKLRSYQSEKKEELDVRKRMLTEIEERFQNDNSIITQLCQDIVDTVTFTRDRTLDEMSSTRKLLESECRSQMTELGNVMAPIRLYLLSAQILCSSASKIDFLQFYADLVKRIQSILGRSIGRPPAIQWKDIDSVRADLVKALEPHTGMSSTWLLNKEIREGSGSASYKGNRLLPSHGFQGVLTKYQIMVDLAGAFGEQFARIDTPLKDMAGELSEYSRKVQEAQRDMTRRKVLLKTKFIDELITSCEAVDSKLSQHAAMISECQPDLQELWQEALDRVRRQQIMYREKVELCVRLREMARQLVTAVRQLASFAECLESMSATIDPKRCHPPDPAPMESICLQISTIEPDSGRRIQAIEDEENNRRINQEAKRREEVEQRKTIGKLHKAKGKKKITRLFVNTNRERSPGGTDVALVSPCMREKSPPASIISEGQLETISSDQDLDLDDLPDSECSISPPVHPFGDVDELTHQIDSLKLSSLAAIAGAKTKLDRELLDSLLCHPTTSSTETPAQTSTNQETTSPPRIETPEGKTQRASDGSTMKGKSRRNCEQAKDIMIATVGARSEHLAARITVDVENSRDTVLRSLNDVFSSRDQEDAVVIEQPNVLASTVKTAERRIRDQEMQKKTEVTRRRRKTLSIGEMADVSDKDDQNTSILPRPKSTPMPVPPPLPPDGFGVQIVNDQIALRPFEAREKVLVSLKARVPRIDSTPEPD